MREPLRLPLPYGACVDSLVLSRAQCTTPVLRTVIRARRAHWSELRRVREMVDLYPSRATRQPSLSAGPYQHHTSTTAKGESAALRRRNDSPGQRRRSPRISRLFGAGVNPGATSRTPVLGCGGAAPGGPQERGELKPSCKGHSPVPTPYRYCLPRRLRLPSCLRAAPETTQLKPSAE